MAASIKYFIKSTIPTFTDWSWYLNGFTVANTQVEFFGGTQADSVRVGAGASANLNDVFASSGNDTLYLTGNFEDYTQTVVGSVYTFTHKVRTSEVISFVSSADNDVVYFANGHVVVGGTSAQPNGRSSLQDMQTGNYRLIQVGDLIAGETPSNPQSGVPSPNTTKVKIVVTGTSDVDIAELQTSGMSAEIYGGGGVDKFYVRQGTSANAQQMFTSRGNDVLYLTGNFSEYTQTVNGTVYTFTHNVRTSEVVSFVSGSDNDVVYFKDGHFVVGATSVQPNRQSALQDPNTGNFRLIDANDMVAGGTPLPASANAPKISSIAIDSATGAVNQTLNQGDVVSIKVTMSEAVTVSGTPRLKLNIGGTEVWADYSAGTGTATTATLTFKYTILDGQTDANGISIPSNALDLNNGTIKSTSSSLDASLTNDTVADNASYGVDTTAPTISSKTTGAIAPGADLSLTVSEVVCKSPSGSITIYRADNSVVEAIDINSTKISLNSTSGTSTTITINPTQDLMAGTSYYAKISDGALQDKAGNNLKGITDQSWTFNAANLSTTVNSKVGANADSQINSADLGTWSLSGTVNDNGLNATNIAIKSITFTSTDLLTVVTLTSSTPGLAMPTVGADKTWKLASSTIWTDLLVSSKTYSVSVELSGQVGSTPTVGSGTLPTNLSYDVAKPTSPTLKLEVDSGSSDQDLVTNNGTITVSQLESGSTWEYSVDSGANWQAGNAPTPTSAGTSSFALTSDVPRATFIAGQIQVRQTDAAGNTSQVVKSDKTLVLDTFATDKPTFSDVPTTDNKEKPTLKVTFFPESSQSTFGAVSGDVVEIYEGLVKLGSATLSNTDISNKWVNVTVDLTLLNRTRTSLDGSHIFKSKIVDVAGNSSAFSDEVTYTLDTNPPSGGTGMKLKSVTSSSSDPTLDDAYTNQDSGSAVFIYTGTDLVTGERFQYKVDEGTWADVSSANINTTTKTITIDSLDLKNSPNVQIRAIDAVGNAITLANQQITYDNVAPTGGSGMSFTNVSSSGSTTGAITSLASGSVVFTYEGADLAAGERFQYRVGTGTWADVSSTNTSTNTVTIDGLPLSGSPNIQIRAVDRAGNATATLATQQITYDNVAPTGGSGMSFTKVISADSTQTGAITNIATGSVVFTYTGADLATGERFQYSKDNGTTWTDVSSTNINTTDNTVTISGLTLSSSPNVQIRAIDTAGNATGTLASQQITYDSTAPTGVSGMRFTKVSSSDSDPTPNDATTSLATGSVVFTYEGADLPTGERFQYSKDNGSTWSDVSSTNINTTDKTVTIDGLPLSSSPIVKIRAVDLVGKSTSLASQQITYDKVAPTGVSGMSFTSVSSSTLDQNLSDAITNQDTGSVVFTYTGADLPTGERFQYSKDNGTTWADVSSANLSGKTITIDSVDLKSSPTVKIRAVDLAGNTTALASQKITSDQTAPTGVTDMSFTKVSSSLSDPTPNDATTSLDTGSVVFTYTGADLGTGERFQFSKDDGATWADVSSASINTTDNIVTIGSLPLSGSPTVRIRAVDLAGNTTALASQKITYDNVAPQGITGMSFTSVSSSLSDPTPNDANTNQDTGSVVFTFTGTGLATGERFQYSLGSSGIWLDVSPSNISGKTVTIDSVELKSSPIVKVRAIDAAGNATDTLASQQITSDQTAPTGGSGMSFTSVSSSALDQNLSDATTNQASGSVVFTYMGADLATDERFQYSKNDGTTWADVSSTNTTANTVTINDLDLRNSPKIQIRAVDLAGNATALATQQITYDGSTSDTASIVTSADAASNPTKLLTSKELNRYLLIVQPTSTPWDPSEIEVKSNGVNVALNKAVYVGAQGSSSAASNLVDGSTSTNYHSDFTPNDKNFKEPTNQWLMVDLGASYAIDSVTWKSRDGTTEQNTIYAKRQSTVEIFASNTSFMGSSGAKLIDHGKLDTTTLDGLRRGDYANTQILKVKDSNTENSISTQSTSDIEKPTITVYFNQNASASDQLDILDGNVRIESRSLTEQDITKGYVNVSLTQPLSQGDHALKAIITDKQGNQSTKGNVMVFSLNSLTPSLSLEKDTGTVGDNNTSNGQVNIANLASGASWEYSTDNGTNWKTGSGTSFTLSKGTYADGYIQARQTANSKTSDINKLGGGQLVVDTDAPSYIAITSVYSGTQTNLIPAKQALTRYLLIYNPDNAPWDPAELEVFSNGVNVALNKSVTVGSQGAFSADYGGSKLVDGKTDTNYHNNYNQYDVLDKQWLMVDLGASYQIDQINWKSRFGLSTLNPYYNARQNSVAIYTSNDDFTTSMSLTDSNGNAQTLTTEKVKTLEAGGYNNYKALQVASANTLAVNSTTYSATTYDTPSFKINFSTGAAAGDTLKLYDGSGQSTEIKKYTLTATDITNGYATFSLTQSLSKGTHAFTAVWSDVAGNVKGSGPAMMLTVVDTTAPVAPTLTLAQDTGKSSDRVTSNGTVIVSGLDTGASWEYSTDTGSTWKKGSGASFILGNGTYADGAVQARQTGANGTLSSANTAFKSVQVQPNSPNDLSIVSVTDFLSTTSGSLMSSREPARYLLIVKPGSSTWDPAELEVFSDGVNVALNKTVTVGSQGTLSPSGTTSYGGANLVDEKNTTFYQTQDNSTASNQWIMVDLGASYAIDRVNWVRRSDTSNSTKDASYAANQKSVEMYASNVDFLASTGLGTSNALSAVQLANLRKGAYVNTEILEISSTTTSPAVTNSSKSISSSMRPTFKIAFKDAAVDDVITLVGEDLVSYPKTLVAADITNGYALITISSDLSKGEHTFTANLKSKATGVSYTSSPFTLKVDATAPLTPTLIPNTTDNQTIDVTGLETGGTWQYSVDSGTTWSNGVGSSFALSNQTYQAGSVKVKQTSAAGVISGTGTNALILTVSKTLLTTPTLTLEKDTETDGDFITSNGTIKVGGLATGNLWKYSVDGGTTWNDGSGTSFSLNAGTYGVNKILVKQTDSRGTTTSATGSNANQFTIQSTNVTLALKKDAGSSNTDGLTSDGTISVTGLASGQAWEYSTDWGATWSTGVNTSFTLASGQYAANSVQVKLSYVNMANGNVKPVAYLTSQVTVDQSSIGALGMNLAIGSGGGTSNGKVTVSGLVSNATWKYSTDSGLSWKDGSGTSFDLSDGTYAANKVQVKQISVAGKESTINQMAGSFTVGANSQNAKLNADNGISSTDGLTNDKKVNVMNMPPGATWSYTTDSGKTWQPGNGTSFDLPDGAYASNDIQVKQTWSSGTNTTSAVSKLSATKVDTIIPNSVNVISVTDKSGDNQGSLITNKQNARYILVLKPNSGTWDPAELEVFSGGVNVAQKKTVTVGSQGASTLNSGLNLVDGKANTYYENVDTTNVSNQWVMVDLGASVPIDRINWVANTASNQKSVEIYGSNTSFLTSFGMENNGSLKLDVDQLARLRLGLYNNTQLLKVSDANTSVVNSSSTSTDSNLPTLKIAFDVGATKDDLIKLYDNDNLTTAIEQDYKITDPDIKNGYALITLTNKLSNGSHAITAVMTDDAGNRVTSSTGFKFTVDTTTMTLSTAANAGTNGITPDINGLVKMSTEGKTLDLTTVSSNNWDNLISNVDLTGTGDNTLLLDARSIQKLAALNAYQSSGANAKRYQLMITGDKGDSVDLQGGDGTIGWTKQTAAYTTTTATYDVWIHDSNNVAVYINKSITSVI